MASPEAVPLENFSVLRERVLGAGSKSSDLELLVEPGTCTAVLLQRIDADITRPGDQGPPGLEEWFASMFATPVEPKNLVALLHTLYYDVIGSSVFRNRDFGYVVQPPSNYLETWDEGSIRWLRQHFESLEPQSADEVGEGLRRLAELLPDGNLIVYNTSTVFTDDETVRGEHRTLRAHRMALTLDKAAEDVNISIIDVDRVIAELGANEHIVGPGVYSAAAAMAIAEEASELILDLPAIAPLIDSETMQLVLPRYDRRTDVGIIERWHVTHGSAVTSGDALFDARFDNLHWKVGGKQLDQAGRNLFLSVVAMADGYLREITEAAGSSVEAGALVGVMTRSESSAQGDVASARHFPVGVRRREAAGISEEDS